MEKEEEERKEGKRQKSPYFTQEGIDALSSETNE
jgi:hypothetical protein